MTIKALLFDKDGTLFHFKATWEAWAHAVLLRLTDGDHARASEVGRDVGFDMESCSFARDSVVIAGTPAEIVEALKKHFDITTIALETILNDEAATAPQVEAVPLVPYMESLRARGLALGVATNDAERPARQHLTGAGVSDLLDFISGYDSGNGVKPDAAPCLAFAREIDVPAGQVAMVGDSLHDLKAGRAAGMRTIGVLTGLATQDELSPFADVVLRDIGEIPAWLDQQA
ncbi:phosphoglycolate phosphatase [Aliiroseovarius halocynthiae]|uniref:phosphoglycolate phosphatase n=1 Tax=Aliiroseovarius halocynthiae TaxID=985055 RepID=A0A545SVD3_9RHOB|nr:HAD family hydrolase [Aliiroseovarius halocynthiae]TQV68904.1 HAD family hydrolase [Aliiroseovarius halocynthiae]SMR71454.1 phosphoglycolate phosphatase [Aliiroseovarius halocynthiae]